MTEEELFQFMKEKRYQQNSGSNFTELTAFLTKYRQVSAYFYFLLQFCFRNLAL